MRALVVFAHPVSDSFSAALRDEVVKTLADAGCDVDECDLYKEGFSPVLTTQERLDYHDESINTAPVKNYVERLQKADALFLVYPVWNFGYPAILKGYFDRVFLPGVSFGLKDGKLSPELSNIKTLVTVTTYGADRFKAFLVGDPPRKSITRHIRFVINRRARTKYLALYDMNNMTDEKRASFLQKVSKEIKSLL